LLKNATCPGVEPAACGVKLTVNGTLLPAGTVVGNVIPLSAYPEPFQLAEDTTIAADPAVSVPLLVWLLPTFTDPKFIEDGVTDS